MSNARCICREWVGDALKVEADCPAQEHGPGAALLSQTVQVQQVKTPYRLSVPIGVCYKVETSYGDDRPAWFVYRRVRASIAGYTECHRFETRCDGMRAMYPVDTIRTDMLKQQIRIEESEWVAAWLQFQGDVTEPWLVE